MQVLNVHGAVVASGELCMHGAVRHVLKCAWSSCMCMSSECESDGEHSTT